MPVSVTLGGDPVYTTASTAPLPENISEYILAGFLREKSKLVKCITNDLYVPYDVILSLRVISILLSLLYRRSFWRPQRVSIPCRTCILYFTLPALHIRRKLFTLQS